MNTTERRAINWLVPFGFLINQFNKKNEKALVNTEGWKKATSAIQNQVNKITNHEYNVAGGDMNAQGVQNPLIYSGNWIQRLLYGSEIDALNAAEQNRYNSEMQAYDEDYNSIASQIQQYQDAGLNYYSGMQAAGPVATTSASAVSAPEQSDDPYAPIQGLLSMFNLVSNTYGVIQEGIANAKDRELRIKQSENDLEKLEIERQRLALEGRKVASQEQRDISQIELDRAKHDLEVDKWNVQKNSELARQTSMKLSNELSQLEVDERKALSLGKVLIDGQLMDINEAISNPSTITKVPLNILSAYYDAYLLKDKYDRRGEDAYFKAQELALKGLEYQHLVKMWRSQESLTDDQARLLKAQVKRAEYIADNPPNPLQDALIDLGTQTFGALAGAVIKKAFNGKTKTKSKSGSR